ncbi:MAG TPA: glycosyltransferase family 2 protein [Polyangia bacterium]|nr:glycosyltransferase family 2 protein [Polyangia bacterium]
MPTLSVVMPAYNEAANLPAVAPRVLEAGRRACPQPDGFELVLVDDGSTDATAAALAALASAHPDVRVLTHERNRGLTAALRTGYYAARKEFVLFIPADGQIPPESIAAFLAAAPGHDVVLSNYRHRPDGLSRAVLSRGLRLLLRVALGFGDRADGPYLFRRALIDQIPLVAERSAGSIGFEIAAKARAAGRPMTTIEIDCLPRLSGSSKVANARNILQYLVEIARIRRSMRS